MKLPTIAIVSLMVAASAAFHSSPGHADTATRLECTAEGPRDISMRGRFERRGSGRRKFNTEFEAAPGGAYRAGQLMAVFVADFRAGTVRLRNVVGGDVGGELELDDTAGPSDDEKPFPAGFPQVVRNTRVLVKIGGQNVLACRLQ